MGSLVIKYQLLKTNRAVEAVLEFSIVSDIVIVIAVIQNTRTYI